MVRNAGAAEETEIGTTNRGKLEIARSRAAGAKAATTQPVSPARPDDDDEHAQQILANVSLGQPV